MELTKRFKLQVRYKNQERDDVVYFSSEIKRIAIDKDNTFIVENENKTEMFVSQYDDILSFSITEE